MQALLPLKKIQFPSSSGNSQPQNRSNCQLRSDKVKMKASVETVGFEHGTYRILGKAGQQSGALQMWLKIALLLVSVLSGLVSSS